jgi:WD40 repeat protein
MLAAMKLGGNDDLRTASQAAQSLAGPTDNLRPIPKVSGGSTADDDDQLSSVPMQLRDPQRYELLGEHGRGGLGRVSRAHDRELGRDVAIKELLSRGNVNEARFLREVMITARLEHPGIVPVHEAGRWPDGTPFYAMKLVSGRPLRDLIAERKTVEDCIGLLHHVITVADAIAYAHGRNIIHRDLKPANVIVGDFGETIVIDWGLAKDLSSDDEPSFDNDPFHGDVDDGLTLAGSVLGTPAYMAPEQARGEHVDQRADVYAIGIMLWELCTVRKRPPARAQLRHRMLRRAGIDRDLAIIINKALEPDPERRYADAGALAADLKAFKSGARIASRSYSLLGMLAHWTRRHRTLALSASIAIVVAIAVTALFVRNIAVERDRADASGEVAKRAQASAEASLDELTLKHAQLLLTTDPSAAVDVLSAYHGSERARAEQIRAEATGRGVAVLRALPHTSDVLWTEGAPDGAIFSLSNDGTISRTSLDDRSVVLARGVSKSGISSYSRSRHLLAYACDPSDLCLFDVARATPIAVAPMLRGASVIAISFSADGNLLAMMSQEAKLRVLDVTDPALPVPRLDKSVDGGVDVEFLGNDVVVVGTLSGIEFVRMNGDAEAFSVPGISRWGAGDSKLALATERGQALVLESFPARVAARADLCHGSIANLRFISATGVAYACTGGTVGIWDLQRGTATPRAQLEGHAELIAASPAGDYIVAAGGNGTVIVVDLFTDLIASYRGHGLRVTSITPPTSDHPYLVSGDVRGAVRAWPVPPRLVRVAATSSSPFYSAIFNQRSTTVTATTWLPSLTVFSPPAGARAIEPHEPHNIDLDQSDSGRTFVTFGLHDLVEVWSFATMTRTRVIATGHGSVSQLRFVDASEDFITSGHDGRLVRWTPDGAQTLITRFDHPIDKFTPTAPTGPIVFSTGDGALWRTTEGGQTVALRPGGSRINRLVTTTDRRTVYAGYINGDVIAIDTASWQAVMLLHGPGAVQEIATTRDGDTVAVATNDGAIHVGSRRDRGSSPDRVWDTLAVSAHHITLTPDGLLVAAGTDGAIWLHSTSRRRSLCLPTGTADFGRTAMSADGKAAVALDREGRLLWIDLEAARKVLDISSPHAPRTDKEL